MKRKSISFFLALCIAVSLLSAALPVSASVSYLPGVTEEMTDPAFWAGRMEDPEALLSTPEEIARINAAALKTEGSNMHDLRSLPARFDGLAHRAEVEKGAWEDAEYFLGWTYDETGKKFTREDFEKIIANCADPDAAADMPVRLGIAVNRALLTVFPYEGQILDDPTDPDFDYQGLVGIRMNEPVAAFGASADGKYLQVYTSCCSGWVRKEDIAFCANKTEWLAAWDIPAEKRLVFWGDKLYTDYSRSAPETACRLITMGTVLERIQVTDPDALIINRLPVHNYAVYLPVRKEDGSYGKTPALLNAREKLSEDYLPLTGANLAKVALASLGDAYGWGATLNNEDCTSLNRNVFACFGLDLPRNGNWQWPLSMPKADVTDLTQEEKEALLDKLPLGTLLDFPGHQMMYLGKVNGSYFCVSTVSSMMSPYTGGRQRSRTVQINDLDLKRGSGLTWLQAVNHISIPWTYLPEGEESPLFPSAPAAWYSEGVAWCLKEGLMLNDADGDFHPEATATRAQAVEALWRAAGSPEPGAEVPGFVDVESGASYEKASLWSKAQGIIQGSGSNDFDPEGTLTRELLVVMLFRATVKEDRGGAMGLAGYGDNAEISSWAYSAMGWAVRTGLIIGTDNGELRPKDPLTRGALAVILLRASELYGAVG